MELEHNLMFQKDKLDSVSSQKQVKAVAETAGPNKRVMNLSDNKAAKKEFFTVFESNRDEEASDNDYMQMLYVMAISMENILSCWLLF